MWLKHIILVNFFLKSELLGKDSKLNLHIRVTSVDELKGIITQCYIFQQRGGKILMSKLILIF